MNESRGLALFSAFAAIFALHLGLSFFSSAILAGVLSAAMLALVLLTITCMGRITLRLFEIRRITESEKTLIGATLGLGLLSQGVLCLAALGWLKAWAVSALLGVFWVVGFTEMREVFLSLGANRSLLAERPLLAASSLACLAVSFWFTWAPPNQYDALVYHLPLAAAYAREGALVALDHLIYSYFPQNAEMLYALALTIGTDILAQMFTWLGTFLSVCWVFEMGKREMPVAAALSACLLVLTHTAVLSLTPTAYVECLVMLWTTASVLCFLRWRMASDEETSARGWLALAGVFAGLGVGTKYTAGITPAFMALYLLWEFIRMRPWSQGGSYVADRFKDFCALTLSAAGAGAPWLIRNAWAIGNPVYPFFSGKLGGAPHQDAARYFNMLAEYRQYDGGFLRSLVEFPYLAAVGSTRFGGGADVLGDLGWGPLFVLLPAAIWAARRLRYGRWLLAYAAAHWAVWFATGTVLRFLVVIVPLAALACAYGGTKAFERAGAGSRIVLGCAAGALLWTNMALFLVVQEITGVLPVLTGLSTRRQYLTERFDYYPCAAFARDNAEPNDRIFVVGEQRGYFVDQPHTTTTPTAPNGFVLRANEAKDAGDLSARLKREGYRYMLFVPREGKRLGEGYGVFHFSEQGYRNWSALEEGFIEPVHEEPGRCVLYRFL